LNSSIAVLNWTEPVPPYGVIIKYDIIVGHDPTVASSGTILYTTPDGTVTSFEFSRDLVPADANLRVRAYTMVGAGPWSDVAIDLIPPPPTTTAEPATVTVIVTSPSVSDASSGSLAWVAAIIVPIVVIAIIIIVVQRIRHRRAMQRTDMELPPPDEWELERSQIHLGKSIGSGAFGQVYSAELMRTGASGSSNVVAVKTVRANGTSAELRAFLEEARSLKTVNTPGHRNVIHLIGCVVSQFPLMIVTELFENSDLKGFLLKHREDRQADGTEYLSSTLLTRFAADIAAGMSYLSEMGWVHRGMSLCLFSILSLFFFVFGRCRAVE
jgi:hypothetical protein